MADPKRPEAATRREAPPCADLGSAGTVDRYCLLFEQSLAGIYRTTLDGRFLDCNESMASMLGYDSREDLMSRPASELYFSPGDRDAFLANLREKGMLKNAECRLRRKDGSPFYALENVILVPDEEGRATVVQGNMVDITERRKAEDALRESERRHRGLSDQLRRLAHRLHAVRDEERASVAREIHDELGQALTALNMDLHWLQARLSNETEAKTRVAAMIDLAAKTMDAVHRLCTDLRPTLLDDFGLTAAMEWHVKEFQRRMGIRCQLSLPNELVALPKDVAIAVFRIFQEGLTNIARHARATRATITLRIETETLSLVIEDNGVGITEQKVADTHSIGLVGMRERALPWRGTVAVAGVEGKGTTVDLRIPLQDICTEPEP